MRVLHVIRRWKGGVGRYVESINREFNKKGIETFVISREEDLNIHSLKDSLFILPKKIQELSEKEDIDVIIAHDWSVALPLRNLKEDLNIYTIFHGREESGLSLFLQRMTSKIYKDRLIVVSKYLNRFFPNSKIVYEGVDQDLFKRRKPLEVLEEIEKPIIGFAQAPTDYYNFGKILKAIKKLDYILALAWDKKIIDDHVVSLGYINLEKMPNFYSSLNVFISLPIISGFNLTWLEALSCGVPTIGNKTGVGEEIPILRIEGKDIEEIKDAISKLYSSIDLQKEFLNKWDKIKDKFTWKNAANSLLSEINF